MKLRHIACLAFFALISLTVSAQTSADLKRKKEALQRDIEQLQKNLKVAEASKRLTLTQVNALKTQIRLRQNKIEVVNSEIKNLDNQIHDNTSRVKNLQGQLGDLKKEYASMIRFAQRNRNSYDKMMFIFAAGSFNQAYKRIKYLQQFGQYRKKQAGYIEGKKKDLNYQIVVLDKDLKAKSNLLHEQEIERNRLQKSKNEQTVVLNKYSKQEKQLKQDIQKRKQQQANIDREIRLFLQREMAAMRKREEDEARAAAAKAKAEGKAPPVAKPKSNSNALTLSPEGAKLSAAFESNKGSLPWPVESKLVTEKFGKHKVDQATYFNDGINIQTTENAGIRAVFDGIVSQVGRDSFKKYFIFVKHGNFISIYSNLKSASVVVGTKVSTKQNIGTVGLNGETPELQFQIRKLTQTDAAAQNPESWLAQ